MRLKDLLDAKRTRIHEAFFRRILSSYPAETASILGGNSDPFLNPVGTIIRRATTSIVDGVLDGMSVDGMTPPLEEMVRIRAVQDFTASEAVSFVFLLKRVLRDEVESQAQGHEFSAELDLLFSRLDEIALAAFNIYVACREKIGEIKLREVQKERDRLLRVIQALTSGSTH